MPTRLVLALVSLAAVLSMPPGAASSAEPATSTTDASSFVAALSAPETAWLAPHLRPDADPGLRRVAELSVTQRSAAVGDTSVAVLRTADVDLDGWQDLLEYHRTAGSDGFPAQERLTVISAASGAPLLRTMTERSLTLPLVTAVSPAGRPGLLLMSYKVDEGVFEVSALALGDRRLFTTRPMVRVAGTDRPASVVGLLEAPGRPVAVLLEAQLSLGAGVGTTQVESASVTSTAAALLSGATGVVTPLGPEVTSAGYPTKVLVGPDLDADGRDDVVLATGGPEHRGTVIARSSRDGAQLWSTTGPAVERFTSTDGIGADLTGDRRPDVVLTSWQTADDPAGPAAGFRCTVLDGETGTPGPTVHRSGLTFCFPNGDGDRDGRADLLVSELGDRDATTSFLNYELLSRGRVLWSRSFTVQGDRSGSSFLAAGTSVDADLQGDGIDEIAFVLSLATSADDGFVRVDGVLDGRSGRSLRFPRGAYPLDVSLDGRGSELLVAEPARGRLRPFTVYDGRTGRRTATYTVTAAAADDRVAPVFLEGRGACAARLVVVVYGQGDDGSFVRRVQSVDLDRGRARWARDGELRGATALPTRVTGGAPRC